MSHEGLSVESVVRALIDAGVRPSEIKDALRVAADSQRRPVVYFAERDGFVKIGTSAALGARLASLNRGDAALPGMVVKPVKLLAVMPGGRAVERSIHETFAALRYGYEWFLLDEPLAGFITAIATAAGADIHNEIQRARRDAGIVAKAQPAGRVTLSDLESVFLNESALSWQELADRLIELAPERLSGLTATLASEQIRGLGVRGVGVKRDRKAVRGTRKEHVEAVLAEYR